MSDPASVPPAELAAALRSFMAAGHGDSQHLRATLLDDFAGSGRGARIVVDATVRAHELGVTVGADRPALRGTVTAEFGVEAADAALSAWDDALGIPAHGAAVTPGPGLAGRKGMRRPVWLAVAVAVVFIAIVGVIVAAVGGGDSAAPATATIPPPPAGAIATLPVGTLATEPPSTDTPPTNPPMTGTESVPTGPPPTADTGGGSQQRLPLPVLFPGIDFTRCALVNQPASWPEFAEGRACNFVLTGDGTWLPEQDVNPDEQLVTTTYTLELYTWPGEQQFTEAKTFWGMDTASPVGWNGADSAGGYMFDLTLTRSNGGDVGGRFWTYEDAMITAIASPSVDDGGEYRQGFFETFAGLGP